ncbi:hypothetical protein F8388_006623 [Cannabis sativa]|uniref:DAGKc domain-containing protein n=1 Tax=Cannabis sativa TaxID=3483 RepID=A0A7J6GV76_CANSA|nr:hypothetical protein F8388_006623 [Cannabis sativa]KAF4392915.1 hypothetical protein G4B88_011910 [Cannabis sativa]
MMGFYQIALGGGGVHGVGVSMAKSCLMNAEQPTVPDLSTERSILGSGSSFSRRRDLVFIVNPRGANGRTGKEWKKLLPYLRSRLGSNCNISESLTSGPSHAIDITREAIREGADAVIAVGGDGTLHEVVNGFFWAGKAVTNHDREATHSTALGLIPLGTGSDFARTLSWPNNPAEAIERIYRGHRSRIDIGVIDGEKGESHYFLNVADIHLSAKAGFFASRYKKFGNLCYVNEGEWQTYPQVTALCIGNGKYFGGGMKITPNADPSSGDFEVVILQDFKWYDFVLKLHKLYNGTHLSVTNVSSISYSGALHRSGRHFRKWKHICSVGWRASRVPAEEVWHNTGCYRDDMLRLNSELVNYLLIQQPTNPRRSLLRTRCAGENPPSNSATEPENALLKAAWNASELLGIATSFFRSPNNAEAGEVALELARDASGLVDRAAIVKTIKEDFERSYFVTGFSITYFGLLVLNVYAFDAACNLTLDAYEDDCEFADPASSFKGLRRFKRNCTNFGSLLERSNMKLMKWEDFEDKGIGHWRFSCVLSFPWKPILSGKSFVLIYIAASGYTEYFFDPQSGKVCRHVEHWNVPKMVLLKQIFRPSRRLR